MKFSTTVVLASVAAIASAQYTYNNNNNTFTCDTQGTADYCIGGDIILRCSGGVGQSGNCNDNLAGEPPVGDDGQAICYQPPSGTGNAACAKNGIAYPDSGASYKIGSGAQPGYGSNSTSTVTGTRTATVTVPCNSTLPTGPAYSNNTMTSVPAPGSSPTQTQSPFYPPGQGSPSHTGSSPASTSVVPFEGAASSTQLNSAWIAAAMGALIYNLL